jgi:hypothetical protein
MAKLESVASLDGPSVTLASGQPFEWVLSVPRDIGSWSEVWIEATSVEHDRRLLVSRAEGLVLVNEQAAAPHHGRLTIEDTTTTTSFDTPPFADVGAGVAIRVELDSRITSRLLPTDDDPLVLETYVRNGRGHLQRLDRRRLFVSD